MDKNLSWTSSLGHAYYNQEQEVMDAIQVMRRRAHPGIWYDDPVIFFGDGFGIGFHRSYGWGCNHWACDWDHHYAVTFG